MPGTVTDKADDLALYYHEFCPFCIRVLRVVERLGIDLEMRDVRAEPANRQELIAGGGRGMVPCLRIDDGAGDYTWMYESADIANYLIRRFGQQTAQG
ncbi:MAG TPA: glutathione S-transferase N-terminal domain-containing protein [Gammaproteobacteria bacterium]|nr:glutathione S-transferase N-terminal domain-containing protein [Gammaproteobacteria bacterium]